MRTCLGIALAAALLATTTGSARAARTGEAVYKHTCFACHMAGVANAPKFGSKAAWAPRIAKGVDALLASAKKGLKAMPPKGSCMDCSDEELKAAIEYMISHATK